MNLADDRELQALNALLAGIHYSTHHAGAIGHVGVDDLAVGLEVLQELPGYLGRTLTGAEDGRPLVMARGLGERGDWHLYIVEGSPVALPVYLSPSTRPERSARS